MSSLDQPRSRRGADAAALGAAPGLITAEARLDAAALEIARDSSDLALHRLRELITSERFGHDGRLPPERNLADELGVSRRAVRQALGTLEAEGRIIRQQGRGTFVAEARPSASELVRELSKLTNPVDTLEARLAIEPMQARLAALRATPGDIDKLFEAAEASRVAADPPSYEKADAAFHRRVAAATRNPLMIAIFEAVMETAADGSWRHGRETAHCINNQAVYAAAHRRIAAAISARNATLAEDAMRAHLTAIQQRLIEYAFPRAEMND
ncbi:FadR/GntR family transcriptional regulator [Rhodoplanes sp. SY1]|uniref:FadR/GntR family transcriptional regulator n=1 Tax=Rhodoplanes sp. SY1 TaxID=3166646 RepID=UPI0038B42BD7